jgi:1,4-dihydroxy-2-naphthoyl-CoA hydrolase
MKPKITAETLNSGSQNTLVSHLGIEFTDVGPDFVSGKMPVDERTRQPYGLLHGGASAALAETLGSVAASLQINLETHTCVGLEININHLRAIRQGYVYGTAKPLHLGRKTQVWEIKITDEAGKSVSVSRLTMMVLRKDELKS